MKPDKQKGVTMSDDNYPTPEEVQEEINKHLEDKYGGKVKLGGTTVTGVGPNMPNPSNTCEQPPEEKRVDNIRFDMQPAELHEYLDRYVIKQDEAKEILATKICTHFNRIAFTNQLGSIADSADGLGRVKSNIMLIGPTGVGKTYLVKLIADKLGVPFVKADATKFSETGYVGGNVEDMVQDLVKMADDNVELAQYGIIYIDEIDKIASSGNVVGIDVSRTGVQRNLLKLLEDTEVDLNKNDPMSQLLAMQTFMQTGVKPAETISTKNILFIVSGAFGGLTEIIKKRVVGQGSIGFGSKTKEKVDAMEVLRQVKPEDLVKFGFESEFIGRIPVISVLEELSADDLHTILRNRHSAIVMAKKQDFKAYQTELCFEDEALKSFAERAYEQKTGARALTGTVERALIPFERKVSELGICKLCVTPDLVEDPRGYLSELSVDANHPARTIKFDEARQKELDDARAVLERKKDQFFLCFAPEFAAWMPETVVRGSINFCVSLEAMYDYVSSVITALDTFETEVSEKVGFPVLFASAAKKELVTNTMPDELADRLARCEALIFNYYKGLNHVLKGKPFTLTADFVRDPEACMNAVITTLSKQLHNN